jgi:hypothetical protein
MCSYFQAREAAFPSKDGHKSMQFFKQLSDAMGDEHDQIVKHSFTGKEKYEDATITLSKDIRKRLTEVVNRTRMEN